jgi:trigger factor
VPSTVEQLSPSRVKITVEVPFTDLKPSMDKAYREIARSVNIPGFRRGKVPPMVIDQRFGRGVVIQEAFNDSWQGFYTAAITENHLNPLAQPDLEVTKLEDGDLIEFTAEVDVRPEFSLPDFTSLSASVDAVDVPEDLIDGQLDLLRRRFGSRETVERPAQDDDVVTINLVATKNGEPLSDATASDLDYTVGSGQMLDGLDDAVSGLAAGESATFTSTLVGGPLKDEEADIEVTVTKVQRQDLPELDDEFAQMASEFDTMEELRADTRRQLTEAAAEQQAAEARDAVLEELLGKVELAVPENLVAREQDARREQITGQLGSAQLTLAQYLDEVEDGKTEEQFWADVENRARQTLKAQMILDKIAEENSIGVDQNDLTQLILGKARQEGSSPQQIADHLKEHPHHIEEYMIEIRRNKALGLLVAAAEVTDGNGDKIDLSGDSEPDPSTLSTPSDQPEA